MVISHTCNKEAEGNICLSEVSGGLCFYFSRLVFTVSLLLNCKFLCLLNVLVILLWLAFRADYLFCQYIHLLCLVLWFSQV